MVAILYICRERVPFHYGFLSRSALFYVFGKCLSSGHKMAKRMAPLDNTMSQYRAGCEGDT